MKKETRGRKRSALDSHQHDGPDREAESGDAEAEAAEQIAPSDGADESAAQESTTTTEPDKPRRRSLPAFGFAADLLRKSEPGETDTGSDSPEPASISPSSETSPALDAGPGLEAIAGKPVAGTQESAAAIDASAPTRIFDFADQITDRARVQEEAAPVQLDTFVTFALAGETFALPVHPVRQIFRVSTITRVPHAPRPIRGVTNLRGRVIPLIDLRLRVGLDETQLQRSSRVISVSSRGRIVGLLVDAVHQVVHLDVLRVQPPPDDVMTIQSDYIQGVYGEGEDLILLLDIDRALIIREAGAA